MDERFISQCYCPPPPSKNETLRPLGTFYFSHSSSITTLLTLLGLYEDEAPLRHDNLDEMGGRKYRSSLIGAFASNVGFVLYECEEEPAERVAVLHQEMPVKLPACKEQLCGWDEFKEKFQVCH